MKLELIQSIQPMKYHTFTAPVLQIKTIWKLDAEIVKDNTDFNLMFAKLGKAPQILFHDVWIDIEPQSTIQTKYSTLSTIANAYCEYNGLQLFKHDSNQINKSNSHRFAHQIAKALYGCHPNEIPFDVLQEMNKRKNWIIVDETINKVID